MKDPSKPLTWGTCECHETNDIIDKLIKDVATAIGDIPQVACAVFQKAITTGLDLASMAVPVGGAVTAVGKAGMKAAKAGLKAGGKAGMIIFCGKHNKYVEQVEKAIPI